MSLDEKDYLEIYKKQSEQQLGWGASKQWNNQDFETLSERILEKTGVALSVTTLKRVWGRVKYDSSPTPTTLNTLAQFSGYESWRSFKSAQETLNIDRTNKAPGSKEFHKADTIPAKKNGKWMWVTGSMFFIVILIFLSGYIYNKKSPLNTSGVIFMSRQESDDLPNSVVFNYDIGNNKTDSAIIQQSWDPKRREKVSALEHQHTSIYYYPGFFKAKLILNNKILKEHDVFIKTNGWRGIIEQDPVPAYLSANDIHLKGNSMQIDSQTLHNKTGKSVFNEVKTNFYLVQEFNKVHAGHFGLETTLQNTSSSEESVCRMASVTILTSGGAIVIPLCGKGCTSAISLYIIDHTISGQDHDLSAFGCDFSHPQKLRCELQNKMLDVYLNDKQIFTSAYNNDNSRIVGLVIGFEGTGKIMDVDLE